MNEFPFTCGHMAGGNGPLCPALSRLKEEHIPLRTQLEQLFQMTQKIGENVSQDDWREPLQQLKEKAVQFEQELDPHSKREEEFLFPAMAKYIGRETGPIAVMEYEHEQGKKNLQTFMTKVDQITAPVNAEEAKHIASYMVEAYQILTQHFTKEEHILFPMAENLLSAEEKDQLAKQILTV